MDNLSDMAKLADNRMGAVEVRKLLSKILNSGGDIQFTEYCEKRMLERRISSATVVNILTRGRVRDA
jgi:hypothetical protein